MEQPIVDAKYEKMVKKASKKHLKTMDIVFIVVMLAGPLAYFCVFWVFVNVDSILMAFKTAQGAWSLDNLKMVLLDIFVNGGSDLGIAIRNTLLYFFSGVIVLPFHLLIAYFLFRRVAGGKVIQVILYLPSIMSGVAIVAAFQNFINPDGPLGIIYSGLFGGELPVLLADARYATWTILFYTLWLGWGGDMLLLGGALARVPLEIFESARLDGIGTFGEIIKMVLPLVWPTMSTLLILQMTGLFSSSGPILLFTGGQYQTTTIAFWIFAKVKYEGASAYNNVAAAGLVFTCIGVPIILGVRKLIELVPTVEY